jgi:hypothetical protein
MGRLPFASEQHHVSTSCGSRTGSDPQGHGLTTQQPGLPHRFVPSPATSAGPPVNQSSARKKYTSRINNEDASVMIELHIMATPEIE